MAITPVTSFILVKAKKVTSPHAKYIKRFAMCGDLLLCTTLIAMGILCLTGKTLSPAAGLAFFGGASVVLFSNVAFIGMVKAHKKNRILCFSSCFFKLNSKNI